MVCVCDLYGIIVVLYFVVCVGYSVGVDRVVRCCRLGITTAGVCVCPDLAEILVDW